MCRRKMKDPLFGDLDVVSGPQVIYAYRHKTDKHWLYLIGENHEIPGSEDYTHISDVLSDNANKIQVFIEKGISEVLLAADEVKQNVSKKVHAPLKKVSYDYIYGGSKVPLVFADVRRDYPYNILESIYGYGSFLAIHHKSKLYDALSAAAFRKSVMKFERVVYKRIASRTECTKFLHSMVYPEHEHAIPDWYSKWLDELGGTKDDRANTLKMLMENNTNQPWYPKLRKYIDNNWEQLVFKNNDIDSTLRRDPVNLVAEKYADIDWYLAVLFGILMEVYIILSVHASSAKIRVVLVGADHCYRLKKYYDILDEYECMYEVNSNNSVYVDLEYQPESHQETQGKTTRCTGLMGC